MWFYLDLFLKAHDESADIAASSTALAHQNIH
jgi:hypothetical protein